MARYIAFIGLLIGSVVLFAQGNDSLDIDQLQIGHALHNNQPDVREDIKKTDVDLMVGTSFTVSPNNYYAPSLYVAPSLRYQLTPRLTLSTGLFLEQSTLYPMQGENTDGFLPMTRAFLYARGDYQLTERLRVNTTVFKGVSKIDYGNDNYAAARRNIEAMEFGLDYKFSDSFSVGVQMRVQNSDYPYYNSPMPYQDNLFRPRYW